MIYKDPAEAAKEAEAEAEKKIAQEKVDKVTTENNAQNNQDKTNPNHDVQKVTTESDNLTHVRGMDDSFLDKHLEG